MSLVTFSSTADTVGSRTLGSRGRRQLSGESVGACSGRIQIPGRADLFDLACERVHVGKLVVAAVPRACTCLVRASSRLPSIVDDREWSVRAAWRKLDDV